MDSVMKGLMGTMPSPTQNFWARNAPDPIEELKALPRPLAVFEGRGGKRREEKRRGRGREEDSKGGKKMNTPCR